MDDEQVAYRRLMMTRAPRSAGTNTDSWTKCASPSSKNKDETELPPEEPGGRCCTWASVTARSSGGTARRSRAAASVI